MGVSKHQGREEKIRRGCSICDNITKDTAREEASVFFIRKDTGV